MRAAQQLGNYNQYGAAPEPAAAPRAAAAAGAAQRAPSPRVRVPASPSIHASLASARGPSPAVNTAEGSSRDAREQLEHWRRARSQFKSERERFEEARAEIRGSNVRAPSPAPVARAAWCLRWDTAVLPTRERWKRAQDAGDASCRMLQYLLSPPYNFLIHLGRGQAQKRLERNQATHAAKFEQNRDQTRNADWTDPSAVAAVHSPSSFLETCPLSTGERTRRVRLVRGKGRDVSA